MECGTPFGRLGHHCPPARAFLSGLLQRSNPPSNPPRHALEVQPNSIPIAAVTSFNYFAVAGEDATRVDRALTTFTRVIGRRRRALETAFSQKKPVTKKMALNPSTYNRTCSLTASNSIPAQIEKPVIAIALSTRMHCNDNRNVRTQR